jgi:hypothetical protein
LIQGFFESGRAVSTTILRPKSSFPLKLLL